MNRTIGIAAAALALAASTQAWAQVQGGGLQGGQGQRGISFVTRRTPMAVPGAQAAGFFAAGGVPINRPVTVGIPGSTTGAGGGQGQGFGGGAFFAGAPVPQDDSSENPAMTREARSALAAAARSGDAGAKWAMEAMAAQKAVPPAPAAVSDAEAPAE
jgi:hypothetical protein